MKRWLGAASVSAVLAAKFFGLLASIRGQARSHKVDRCHSGGLQDSEKKCLAEASGR